jgi:integrase
MFAAFLPALIGALAGAMGTLAGRVLIALGLGFVTYMRVLSVQAGRHPTHVFAFKGEVIAKVSTAAWKKALKRAGIDDFRWHDLRHTWASWHVQNGTPLNVLQELGGWESPQMVRRYAHFSAGHLAAYVSKLPLLIMPKNG